MRKALVMFAVLVLLPVANGVFAETTNSASVEKNGTVPTNAVTTHLVPYAVVNEPMKVTITAFAQYNPIIVEVRWVGMRNNPANLPDLSRTLELERGVHEFHDFFREVIDFDGHYQTTDRFRGRGYLLFDVHAGNLPVLIDVHQQQLNGLVMQVPVLNRDDLFRSREPGFISLSAEYPATVLAINVSDYTDAMVRWSEKDGELTGSGQGELSLPAMSVKEVYLEAGTRAVEIDAEALAPGWDIPTPFVYFFVMEHKYTDDKRVIPTFRLFPMLEEPPTAVIPYLTN